MPDDTTLRGRRGYDQLTCGDAYDALFQASLTHWRSTGDSR
jgi:hypothetical protein